MGGSVATVARSSSLGVRNGNNPFGLASYLSFAKSNIASSVKQRGDVKTFETSMALCETFEEITGCSSLFSKRIRKRRGYREKVFTIKSPLEYVSGLDRGYRNWFTEARSCINLY